jgi:hypothetical protein
MTNGPEPWEPGSGAILAGKRYAPATERNRDAMLNVLREQLPPSGLVLEVASGSGEHAVHFAAALPHLDWQPSDPDPASLASIEAWRKGSGSANLRPPIHLDAAAPWPLEHAAAILCINMVHISPWRATIGLLRGAGACLPPGGLLYLYGPYLQDDVQTAPSNLAFDASLRMRDPEWGLRRAEDLISAANIEGLRLNGLIDMPANNLSLLFRRRT